MSTSFSTFGVVMLGQAVLVLRPLLDDDVVNDLSLVYANAAASELLGARTPGSFFTAVLHSFSLDRGSLTAALRGSPVRHWVQRPDGPREVTVERSTDGNLVVVDRTAVEGLHAAVERSADAVTLLEPVLDTAGEIVDAVVRYANPATVRVRFGDDPTGKAIRDCFNNPDEFVAALRTAQTDGSARLRIWGTANPRFCYESTISVTGSFFIVTTVQTDGDELARRELVTLGEQFAATVGVLDDVVQLQRPIFDSTGTVVDAEIVYTNRGLAAAFGKPFHVGIKVSEVLPAELLGPSRDTMDRAWRSGGVETLDIDNLDGHLPGRYFTTVRVWRTGDLVAVATRDLTGVLDAVAQTARTEQRFRDVVDSVSALVYLCRPILDGTGTVVDLEYTYQNAASLAARTDGRGGRVGARLAGTYPGCDHVLDTCRSAWEHHGWPRIIHFDNPGFGLDPGFIYEHVEILIQRIGDELIIIVGDRTSEHKARVALEEAAQRRGEVLDALFDGVELWQPIYDDAGDVVDLELLYLNETNRKAVLLEREPGLRLSAIAGLLSPEPADRALAAICAQATELLTTGGTIEEEITSDEYPYLTFRHARLRRTAVDGALLYTFIDTTAETERATLQAEQAARNVAIVDRLMEGVSLWDPVRDDRGTIVDLAFVHSNPALVAISTVHPERGVLASELLTPTGYALAVSLAAQVFADGDTLTVPFDPNVDFGLPIVGTHGVLRISCLDDQLLVTVRDDTALVAANDATLTEGERYRRTVDSIGDAVLLLEPTVDDTGTVTALTLAARNPATAVVFPALPSDLVEMHDPCPVIAAYAAQVLVTREPATVRLTADNCDFVTGDVSIEATLTPAGATATGTCQLLLVARDRTADERSRARFQAVAEGIANPVLIITPVLHEDDIVDGVVTYANPAAAKLGLDPTALVGSSAAGVLGSGRLNRYMAEIDQFGTTTFTAGGRTWQANTNSSPGGDQSVVVLTDVTTVEREMAELTDLATRDSDTGLLTRAGLTRRLGSCPHGGSQAIVLVELGQLEQIQRTYGYGVADDVIATVASRLVVFDGAARLGTATFAVHVDDVQRSSDVLEQADYIVQLAAASVSVDGARLRLDATAGVVLRPLHGNDPDVLIRRAKTAAWHAGRRHQRAVVWSPALEQPGDDDLALLHDLERGLDAEEFYVEYQPKWTLPERRFAGAEAIVRWRHPTEGVIAGPRFANLVEASPLGRRYLEHVVGLAVRGWCNEASVAGTRVAVNLPRSLVADSELVRVVADALLGAGAAGSVLELEIPERGLADGEVRAALEELAAMDVALTIDDFGSGAAALTYLRRLPVHGVKLDRSFTRNLARDQINRAVVQACVTVADAVGLAVAAEGIENEAEAAAAAELGCRLGQGFHLGRPVADPARLVS